MIFLPTLAIAAELAITYSKDLVCSTESAALSMQSLHNVYNDFHLSSYSPSPPLPINRGLFIPIFSSEVSHLQFHHFISFPSHFYQIPILFFTSAVSQVIRNIISTMILDHDSHTVPSLPADKQGDVSMEMSSSDVSRLQL